jgi:predicted enzyme related to lactoylglutathione lyase
MTKIDPIIAVKDIEISSKWYQSVFNCRSMHGGKEFDILVSENDEILICLHKWGEHGHPTMTNPNITPGNGLILYFRTENLNDTRQNVEKLGCTIEEDIHVNPNSTKKEFSLRDPDGYYLTITEFHKYDVT